MLSILCNKVSVRQGPCKKETILDLVEIRVLQDVLGYAKKIAFGWPLLAE